MPDDFACYWKIADWLIGLIFDTTICLFVTIQIFYFFEELNAEQVSAQLSKDLSRICFVRIVHTIVSKILM